MTMWAFPAVVSSAAFLGLGVYALARDSVRPIIRTFFFYCFVCSYAAFTEFMSRQAESADVAVLWLRMGAFWPFLLSAQLQFILQFTGRFDKLPKIPTYALIYVPPAVLMLLFVKTDLLVTGMVKEPWGYSRVMAGFNWAFWFLMLWTTAVSFGTLSLCLLHYYAAKDGEEKSKAKYVLIGLSISILAAFATEVMSHVYRFKFPGLGSIASLSIPLSFIYGIRKFDLFALTPTSAAETILSAMNDCLLLVDASGSIKSVNHATLAMLGYCKEDLVNRPMQDVLGPGASLEKLEKAVGHLEMSFRTKAGEIIPVSASISVVWGKYHSKRGIILVAQDITERKRLEREIVKIEEREKMRVGQDLHDGLGQDLTAIAFKCKALEQQLATDSPMNEAEARGITHLVNQASNRIRQLSKGLSPVHVENGGLAAALEGLAHNTEETFGVQCEFEERSAFPLLDDMAAVNLYRIAQEAVTNAIKHASPTRIDVIFERVGAQALLVVKDNGKGMGPTPGTDRGMGLRIMSYRAHMIGAVLDVRPRARGGTAVICWLAIQPNR